MKIPLDIQQKFIDFMNGTIAVAEFEAWVYADQSLEALLGEEAYLELISFNFKQKSVQAVIQPLLNQFIDYAKHETLCMLNLLKGIRDNTEKCPEYLMKAYDLYCAGYEFFDNIGLGFGLKVVVPWNHGAKEWEELDNIQKVDVIAGFYPQLSAEAEKVINWLKDGTIVLTGMRDVYARLIYTDNRFDAEKGPTAYTRERR